MTRRPFPSGRSLVLGAMVLVTAWSLMATAEPLKHKAASGNGASSAHHHEPAHAEPPGGGAGGGEEKADEKPEDGPPPPMNLWSFGGETPPFLATLINFALLAAGFYWMGRQPIAASLKSRRDTIAKEIDEAQAMKHEAEERAKEYQAKLERIDAEVRGMREALLNSGAAEAERLVREAEAKAERMRKDAEFLVQQELKQLREDLWRETVEAAIAGAETMLRERVTPADQERLANEFVADLNRHEGAARVSGAAS